MLIFKKLGGFPFKHKITHLSFFYTKVVFLYQCRISRHLRSFFYARSFFYTKVVFLYHKVVFL